MSELTTLALIGIVLTLSSVAILYADRWWHNRKEAIATGVSNGVPISGRHRWLILYNQWMVLGVSIATYAVIMGFLFVPQCRIHGDCCCGLFVGGRGLVRPLEIHPAASRSRLTDRA
jgi:hypothetical protein